MADVNFYRRRSVSVGGGVRALLVGWGSVLSLDGAQRVGVCERLRILARSLVKPLRFS
ncbi:MAG TPA: hypothetical protein VF666_01410 [Pyrinomonadaceae bacterium]